MKIPIKEKWGTSFIHKFTYISIYFSLGINKQILCYSRNLNVELSIF